MSSSASPPLRHLYRHLLRESSYLIIPQCRDYTKAYIISQFRRHQPSPSVTSPPIPDKEITLRRRARRYLSLLTRTNLCHNDPFNYILNHTFARRGPRRRQLMHNLMHPSSPEPYPSPLQVLAARDTTWRPPPTIQALMKAQESNQAFFTQINYKIKPNGPGLPSTNIWGKPMPRCRTKNAWARWYATFSDRLYPPLPEEEYKSIVAIAEGRTILEPIPRRTKASVPVFTLHPHENQVPVDNILSDPRNKQKKLSARPTTQRFIQRRMIDLLGHIPRPIKPTDPNKPMTFTWRDPKPGTQIHIHEPSNEQAKLLFG